MTTQYDHGHGSSGNLLAFLLALFLGAAALAVFLRNATNAPLAHLAHLITGRSTTVDVSAPAVVEKIQKLSRLESVVYSQDIVVEGVHSSAIFPDLLAGDRILLVVHGQSIAGIDLGKLKPEDVAIRTTGNGDTGNGRSIRVNLPPSELFLTNIDNQHTRVYARSVGLLVASDQNLESDTRAKAQEQLQKAALADGILDTARKNARATVTTLLYSFGFTQVEVQ